MIRIERFDQDGGLIVKGKDLELIGIAVKTSGSDADDVEGLNLWHENMRIMKGVHAYLANTEKNPTPFEIHHKLRDGGKLEIEGINPNWEVVAWIRENSKAPRNMYAESFVLNGSGTMTGSITLPAGRYRLTTLYGFEYDTSFVIYPSSFLTKVYVDGVRIANGPMHTIVSRPGYVREFNVDVYQQVWVEVAVGSSPNKPKIIAVFTEIPRVPVEAGEDHEKSPLNRAKTAVE